MGITIKKKHVWANSRVEICDDMVALYERKPFETACALVFVVGPVLCWFWVVVRQSPPSRQLVDWALVLGSVGAIPGLAVLLLYRPPRVLRLYPHERVAHVSRRFYWL